MDAAVDIKGLYKSFGATPAVAGLTLRVEAGEVVGLVGADGAGKTSTLRMLCGLSDPDRGEIRILGHRVPQEVKRIHALMGYMPQQYSLYGDLSVQENIRFFAGMYGVDKATARKREVRLLDIARLAPFRDRPAGKLSGGMYKKLALSCVLMHEPKLLLLDEPTNGVDPISRRELWAFLYELVGEGVSVLVSTAYMDEAERCSRVALMDQGRLGAYDSPAVLRARFDQTVFEVETEPFAEIAPLFSDDPRIGQVYLVGKRVHLICSQGLDFAATIRRRLEESGLAVRHLEAIPPSFEDIFFHVTRDASGAGKTRGTA